MRHKRDERGLTLVEIMIVISVIAALAIIAAFSFIYVQKQVRDSDRDSKAEMIAAALEDYYDQNGEYPSCNTLKGDVGSVTKNILKSLQPSALTSPLDEKDSNSIDCKDLAAISEDNDKFSYHDGGSSDCVSGAACESWVITYRKETGGEGKIASRHDGYAKEDPIEPVDSPSGITLTAEISGSNAVATAAGGTCDSDQNLQRQIRHDNGSHTNTPGTWTDWEDGKKLTTSANEGWKYQFTHRARCVTEDNKSDWKSVDASTVRSIAKPNKPSVSTSTSGSNTTFTSNVASCPTQTSAEYRRLNRIDDNSSNPPGWTAASTVRTVQRPTSSQGFKYTTSYQVRCKTTHTTSAWSNSGAGSYTRAIAAPTIKWTFTKSGSFTLKASPGLTCGPGVSPYGDINLYSYDLEWAHSLKKGWYTSGYSQYDKPSPVAQFIRESGNKIPKGSRFKGLILGRCKNTVTGRVGPNSVRHTSSIWSW